MSKTKIVLLSLLTLVTISLVSIFLWQKPKVEALAKKTIESLTKKDDIPVQITVERTNLALFPPQIQIINATIQPKKDLKKIFDPFHVDIASIQPSLLDLLIGKFWISHIKLKGAEINLRIKDSNKKGKKKNEPFNFNKLLQQVPISQVSLSNIKFNVNFKDQYFATTDNLQLKAYNKKSSVILTAKEPNFFIKKGKKGKGLNFLLDSQLMLTQNTLSLSKLKIVKDASFFIASGNTRFSKNFSQIDEININTRIKSSFVKLDEWSNYFKPNTHLKALKGSFKTDIDITKTKNSNDYAIDLDGSFQSFQIENVILGDFDIQAKVPNKKEVIIPKISLNLSGNNKALIENAKIFIDKKTTFNADVTINNAQLHSFLKDSTIADIPVWLNVSGKLKCAGSFEKKLNIDCPGTATAQNLKVQNGSRTKNIVKAKKVDIDGTMKITEDFISYKASAKMPISNATSEGIISFKDGFSINYDSPSIDFTEIGPIGELNFKGTGSAKGITKGTSKSATFSMDVQANEFEFEDYYFGSLKTNLGYRSGSIFLKALNGDLESTRFNGQLNINLEKEMINGDIQLPFFRMEDIQQAVVKKVDLGGRFLGSGSGRISIGTPFESDRMTFSLDARLFKGSAFGEEYNEAKLQAVAKEGLIQISQLQLLKEKSAFQMKGTLDTKLNTKLFFDIVNGQLQHSTLLRKRNLPVSGNFVATGKITGKLGNPGIETKARVEDLIFNNKNYGAAIFSFNNADKQTSLQFNIPEQLDLLVLLPEKEDKSFFIDLEAKKLDIAPIIGFLVTKDSTRSYLIETTGEISGRIDANNFWDSEFSSTIQEVAIDYKSNKITSTLPTNIELKNHKLFLNELSIKGQKQFIKVTQPSTSAYNSTFVINGRMNISFFKLIAPFIEKIDGFSQIRLELTLKKDELKLIGSSYTTDSFLKFPGFPHAFEDLNIDVLFNQNRVSINSITGRFADGKLLGNGEIQFNGPKSYELKINTNLEDINIHFPKDIHTTGNATMSLSGSGVPFKLAGEYNVKKGLIEKELGSTDELDSANLLDELLKEEIDTPMILDIDINAENGVEVKNSLIEGTVLGKMKVFDKMDSPRIKGSAKFDRNTIILFRDSEFELTDSDIQFMGRNPIDPNVLMRAETRVNSYDVNLSFQRRSGKQQLNVSSQPPLPEEKIISMLALGQLPDQLEQDLNSQQQQQQNNGSSFQIGTSLLSNNPLGKELKDRWGLDVQFSSSFDDQSNVAVPKITVRKDITKKLQISGSRTTGNASQSEGKVTYEIDNEFSTIFRIQDRQLNTNQNINPSGNDQINPFGVDVEYKVEFD